MVLIGLLSVMEGPLLTSYLCRRLCFQERIFLFYFICPPLSQKQCDPARLPIESFVLLSKDSGNPRMGQTASNMLMFCFLQQGLKIQPCCIHVHSLEF